LEDEADLPVPDPREFVVLEARDAWPFRMYSPAVGVSRQPTRFISVDLPDPDGPMIATYSFRSIARSTPRSARTVSVPIR